VTRVPGQPISMGGGQPVLYGIANSGFTSVAAVLPDGRSYPGTMETGRGFTQKAWAVTYPDVPGVDLVFGDGAGSSLGTSIRTPPGPPVNRQPRSGGVLAFRYPAGHYTVPGSVTAYLINGHVGFWTSAPDTEPFGQWSPTSAISGPALGGIMYPFGQDNPSGVMEVGAMGYAHANVARVVLRLADGSKYVALSRAAGWPGSDLRLWSVALPGKLVNEITGTIAPVTATAYNAAGQVIGQVQLGTSGR
jgi:hypothetical protein